jgi:hypothetical protein
MTNKKPTKKKATAKPQAKKPVAKKPAVAKTPKTETVKIRIDAQEAAHEAAHARRATAAVISSAPTPKKKSLWRRIFGFGF